MHFLDELSKRVGQAFATAGLDIDLGHVRVSDRPDLAQFQCNGALAAAKTAKQNPRAIAEKIAEDLRADAIFKEVAVAGPGFLNLILTDTFLTDAMLRYAGLKGAAWQAVGTEIVILDFGGPNVAKPLHVGHLRAAIIGESLKRILRYVGATVIGDVHFGDWGLQMGQLISELEIQEGDLPYFDEDFTGPYPSESPVSLKDLEALYPVAAANCKADADRLAVARKATFALQEGRPGYRALWEHFVQVSRAAIEAEYADLDVSFDLWKGESDAHPLIKDMLLDLRAKGLAEDSEGALIMRVAREDDNKDIPPVMLVTSQGSVGYHTTDIATILDRVRSHDPQRMLYVVDQRQGLHFEQVFRAAAKADYFPEDRLEHLGFGTMNGADGKPFKTREGGVLKLRDMIDMVTARAGERLASSGLAADYDPQEKDDIARKVGIAALKFADLCNPRTSDYVFDLDRFLAFEGKTGPYLLYACVRIQSILRKMGLELRGEGSDPTADDILITANEERDLALCLLQFGDIISQAYHKRMPHVLCDHGFLLAQAFSKFYAACPVANEPDERIRLSRALFCQLAHNQLYTVLDLLAIRVPTRM